MPEIQNMLETWQKQSRIPMVTLRNCSFIFFPKMQQEIQKTFSQSFQISLHVEIFPKNASKGEALSRLASYLHIQKECIACIGDGENDLGMFRVSGLRFAMGNAVPALKQQADYILPSNREDGVAEAISRYILQERTS
ncbi:MAG: HAD-IIB family hydrolase [Clostridiales bacterium]|nr:HAD-IIB family hydrolase [Clostridiales bacterium]